MCISYHWLDIHHQNVQVGMANDHLSLEPKYLDLVLHELLWNTS